jgi:uncharacterized protein YggE
MKVWLSVTLTIAVASSLAQVGGGQVYGQANGKAAAETAERNRRSEDAPAANSMFVDAAVLINVKADEFVAVFGFSQEGATLEESNQKAQQALTQFTGDLKALGITSKDMFIDFVAQNRIYGYEVVGDVAKEKVVGFEVKKNIAIHYKERDLLDKLVAAAAKSQIFDLVKVDYVVKDVASIQNRLMEEAAKVIKRKLMNRARLLGTPGKGKPQVYAEKYGVYYPGELYDSYTAFEAEDVSGNYYRQRFVVQGARKARTFYFNALNGKLFDQVLNPVVVEPVVQFTIYLKVRYETLGAAKKS